MEELLELITAQQSGHENTAIYMVGEQLKDMAAREPAIVSILSDDLKQSTMTLGSAAAELQKYADAHKDNNASCFCITPLVAEGILRSFYGLPEREEAPQVTNQEDELIRLADFL